jgi:hypothetical protein
VGLTPAPPRRAAPASRQAIVKQLLDYGLVVRNTQVHA